MSVAAMSLLILVFICAGCIAGSAVALAIRKVASPKSAHPLTPEWIEEMSVERYRPMIRLLDDSDLRSLRERPGVSPQQIIEFRRERSRIFRNYLKRLNADFASVCLALKVVMLQSQVDRPDLASTLLRTQFRFAVGLVWVQVRLGLYDLGIGTVKIDGLLSLFDNMRLELRSLTPAPESAVWGS